jgi:hypothetical protein
VRLRQKFIRQLSRDFGPKCAAENDAGFSAKFAAPATERAYNGVIIESQSDAQNTVDNHSI